MVDDYRILTDEGNQTALLKEITKLGYLRDDCHAEWELLDVSSFA